MGDLDDRNVPATKGDIADLRSELKGSIDQLRTDSGEKLEQLRSEVNHGYNDIVERIHNSQTAVLKTFYSYAEGNKKRVAEFEDDGRTVRSRLATIEDRLLEVERRLNMPPAA
ncbi:MAG: hypothetical protein ABSB15_21660 [Bryobacteraceae bacterium]